MTASPTPSARIAVTTPTGNVGSELVHALLRAGIRPSVLVRDPARLPAKLVPLIDVRTADQRDPDAVCDATADVDALYWVDPPSASNDPLADYARATEALVHAVRENRIRRVVFQSSIGAEVRHGAGEIDGLAATEVALDATDADVTHLRCGYFFSNLTMQPGALRDGVIRVVLPTDQPLAWVAPRDIAEVAALRLLEKGWTGRQVHAVHGPEDLSWDAAAAIVSDAVGRPLRAERVADSVMRADLLGAGMSEGLAGAVLGMSTGLREGFTPEQPRTPSTTTPTTLRSWAFDVLRPLL